MLQSSLVQPSASKSILCIQLVLNSVLQNPLVQPKASKSIFCIKLVLNSVLQNPLVQPRASKSIFRITPVQNSVLLSPLVQPRASKSLFCTQPMHKTHACFVYPTAIDFMVRHDKKQRVSESTRFRGLGLLCVNLRTACRHPTRNAACLRNTPLWLSSTRFSTTKGGPCGCPGQGFPQIASTL